MQKLQHQFHILSLIAILGLASLACSIGGLTLGRNSATLDIQLKEDQLNDLFERVASQTLYGGENLLKKLEKVEMHEGFVRIYGSHDLPDGSTVNGSFDVSVGALNNTLQVQVIAVDIPGMDLNNERIQNINQTLTEELTRVVTETNGDVSFQKAEVHEDALYLTVEVKYQVNP